MNESARSELSANTESAKPWYREPWPWVIIAIPLMTVVASMITLWLAITHPDHLVVDESAEQDVNPSLKAARPAVLEAAPEKPQPDGHRQQ
jgi:hypothetical protein